MSIMGLNPPKITSLDSLAAFVKMQPKYPIESSCSAQPGRAISDAESLLGASSGRADTSRAGSRNRSGNRSSRVGDREPSARTAIPSSVMQTRGVENSLAPGGRCCFSERLWAATSVGEHFFHCCLIAVMLILKWWGSTGRWQQHGPSCSSQGREWHFYLRGKAQIPISLHRLGEWGEESKTFPRFLFHFRKVFSKAHPLFTSCRLYLVLSSPASSLIAPYHLHCN